MGESSKQSITDFEEALLLLEDPLYRKQDTQEEVPTTSGVSSLETGELVGKGDPSGIVLDDDQLSSSNNLDKNSTSLQQEMEVEAIAQKEIEELEATIKLNEEDEKIRLRMRLLLANFNQEQLDRYEAMRRASFPKSVIRRLVLQFTNATVNQNVVIALAGMAKVFTGELVEQALDIKDKEDFAEGNEQDKSTPLTPRHLFLSFDKLDREGKAFPARPRRCTFLNKAF